MIINEQGCLGNYSLHRHKAGSLMSRTTYHIQIVLISFHNIITIIILSVPDSESDFNDMEKEQYYFVLLKIIKSAFC